MKARRKFRLVGSHLMTEDRGAVLHGEALASSFDELDAQPDRSEEADHLVRDRARELLTVRRDAVLARLTSPARGPGTYGTAAAAAVLRILGPTPAVEQAWVRWIDEGRFDGPRPDDADATTVHTLAETLWLCVEDGVLTEDHALVHVALAHWSELLRSPDLPRRRRGLRVVLALLETGRPFPSALGHMVVRATRDDVSPEAALARAGVEALLCEDREQLADVISRLAATLPPRPRVLRE